MGIRVDNRSFDRNWTGPSGCLCEVAELEDSIYAFGCNIAQRRRCGGPAECVALPLPHHTATAVQGRRYYRIQRVS